MTGNEGMVSKLYKDNTARQPEFASNSPEQEGPRDAAKPHPHVISMNPNPTKDSERPAEGPTRTEKDSSMPEDFAAILDTLETEQAAQAEAQTQHEGDVLKGTVINITPTHVVVDIGNKSDGMVPIAEATDRDGNVKFQPGDPIDVVIA